MLELLLRLLPERTAPLAVTKGRHIDRRQPLDAGSWAQGAGANKHSKRLV